jgi:DNA primase
MISGSKKLTVISVLNSALGAGSSLKNNEQQHYCPFCHHSKKKLQINLDTQQWHCWVCDAKGLRITSLLRKLKVDINSVQKINTIYGDDYTVTYNKNEDYPEELELPNEYKPLYNKPKSINPIYNKAIHYLKKRNIGEALIIKYNIGYCDSGDYAGRIIIPSYDSDGKLNYFEARTFYDNVNLKYKKPPVSRNVIAFENQINWK